MRHFDLESLCQSLTQQCPCSIQKYINFCIVQIHHCSHSNELQLKVPTVSTLSHHENVWAHVHKFQTRRKWWCLCVLSMAEMSCIRNWLPCSLACSFSKFFKVIKGETGWTVSIVFAAHLGYLILLQQNSILTMRVASSFANQTPLACLPFITMMSYVDEKRSGT